MKRVLPAVFLFFFCLPSAQCNPLSKVKHWVGRHKVFVITSAAMVGALVADSYTTYDAEGRCPNCREQSFVLPKRPSVKALTISGLAQLAGYGALHWIALEDDDEEHVKAFHYVVPASAAVFCFWHSYGAYHNAGIRRQH